MADPRTKSADWIQRRGEQEGLSRYVQTLRERLGLILVCILATTLAATIYVLFASSLYRAKAELLVTPVSRDDSTLTSLGLIRDSNDPTRDVSTAAQLVTSTDVARDVKNQLRLKGSVTQLLRSVTSEPVAQSNLVAVTASGSTRASAQRLANAFADATVRDRTVTLHRLLDTTIPSLEARLAPASEAERAVLSERLAALKTLRAGPDPTVRVETRAEPPESAARPRAKLSLAAGLLSGVLIGVAAAFGLQSLDPRLRREEQLRALFRLPILARIPRERRTRSSPLTPDVLTAASAEGYRTLRATVAAATTSPRGDHGKSILITGSSPSEGKSTTAVNLAVSLAQAGHHVILMEADLRRPTLADVFGVVPRLGIASVLIEQTTLEDALITTKEFGPDLELLLVDLPGVHMADRLSLPTARQLILHAETLADYVIIDSPPLTEVIDALPLAQQAGNVLIVARIGRSRLNRLEDLGELLAQHDIMPIGIAVVGVERSGGESGYYTSEPTAIRRAWRARRSEPEHPVEPPYVAS
jgi:capsular exopolysaccharide synthesis family protein